MGQNPASTYYDGCSKCHKMLKDSAACPVHADAAPKKIFCLQVTLQDPRKTYEVAVWHEALQEFGQLVRQKDIEEEGAADKIVMQSKGIEFVACSGTAKSAVATHSMSNCCPWCPQLQTME